VGNGVTLTVFLDIVVYGYIYDVLLISRSWKLQADQFYDRIVSSENQHPASFLPISGANFPWQ
jgi:hypothetical protein